MKKLFRPVGTKELELILDTDCKRFPPRLSFQPIFYPVLNEEYAIQIASRWNTKDSNSGFSGYVTEFNVCEQYVSGFEAHIVGGSIHEELWVPAECLEEFNLHIKGPILISHAFYGEKYKGAGKENCYEKFVRLFELSKHDTEGLFREIQEDWKAVTLNYFAWLEFDCDDITSDSEKADFLFLLKKILQDNNKWFFNAEIVWN